MWNVCPIEETASAAANYGVAGQAADKESCLLYTSLGWFDVHIDMGVDIDTPITEGIDFALYVDDKKYCDLPSKTTGGIRMILRASKSISIVQVRANASIQLATFSLTATRIKPLCDAAKGD